MECTWGAMVISSDLAAGKWADCLRAQTRSIGYTAVGPVSGDVVTGVVIDVVIVVVIGVIDIIGAIVIIGVIVFVGYYIVVGWWSHYITTCGR